jgi:hypothetical protein
MCVQHVRLKVLEDELRMRNLRHRMTLPCIGMHCHVCFLCRLQMLLQALVLFTEPRQEAQQAQLLTVSCGDSLADDLSISDQAGQPAQLLGFEQHFRAGSFKGRVALQVVRTTQQGAKLFAGRCVAAW